MIETANPSQASETIMYNSDSSILILFLLLAAVIVAYAVYVGLRKPNRRVPTLTVNRKNLRKIGYLRSLTVWFIFIPLVIAAAMACWISGRMRADAALGAAALLLISPLIFIFQLLNLQYPPLRRALAEEAFDSELRGKKFLFLQDAWQYADKDWFIRVGTEYSAALCARWINFEKPARLSSRIVFVGGAGRPGPSTRQLVSPQLRFTCRDGSEIVARLDASPDIVKWVKNHGGRIEK